MIGHCSNSPGHKASYTAGYYLLFLPALSSLCMQCVCCLQGRWAGLQSAVDTSFCCYRQLCYAACRPAQCSLCNHITKTILLFVFVWKMLYLDQWSAWAESPLWRWRMLARTRSLTTASDQWLCRDGPCYWHQMIHNVCCWPSISVRPRSAPAPDPRIIRICLSRRELENVQHLRSDNKFDSLPLQLWNVQCIAVKNSDLLLIIARNLTT